MKVTVERAALLKALGHVHRVVERRNTIPILANVLLRADGQGLRLKATDLDIEVTETIPADVTQAGATTVPAHVIYDIVRKLPEGGQVSLEIAGDAGQMQIRSGRSRFMLQALPEADFPDLAAGDMPHRFTMPAIDLKRLIEKTQFAISTEETRYYLNGIYFHTLDADGVTLLRAVATDGHRLARVEMTAPEGAAGMPGIIVPRKAVAEIQKLVEDEGSDVSIELSPTKIRLTFGGRSGDESAAVGGVLLTSKLIDGTFPDYQRVIPTGNDKRLTVERGDFAKAVDRVSTISSERGRAVKLALTDRRLTLSVNNPDSGSATEEIEVDYDASPLDIGFNARYLLDITGQLDGDTALFQPRRPGLADGDPGPRGRPGAVRPHADAGVMASPLVGEVERTDGAPGEGGDATSPEASALPPSPQPSAMQGRGGRCAARHASHPRDLPHLRGPRPRGRGAARRLRRRERRRQDQPARSVVPAGARPRPPARRAARHGAAAGARLLRGLGRRRDRLRRPSPRRRLRPVRRGRARKPHCAHRRRSVPPRRPPSPSTCASSG